MNIDIEKNPTKRLVYYIAGFLFVFIGILGVLLPVLPGVPFFILAAYFFAKSSVKMHNMLLHNKYIGHYIRDYHDGAKMPVKAKLIAITLAVMGFSFSMWLIFAKGFRGIDLRFWR